MKIKYILIFLDASVVVVGFFSSQMYSDRYKKINTRPASPLVKTF